MKLHQILSYAAKGLIMGIGFFSVIAIAFAFTTWSSGNSPQTSPANGNVQILPIPLVCSGSNKALQWNGNTWICATISSGSEITCISCLGGGCVDGYAANGSGCCGVNPSCRQFDQN